MILLRVRKRLHRYRPHDAYFPVHARWVVVPQETAVAQIKRRYATARLSEEDIHTCLYSM